MKIETTPLPEVEGMAISIGDEQMKTTVAVALDDIDGLIEVLMEGREEAMAALEQYREGRSQ